MRSGYHRLACVIFICLHTGCDFLVSGCWAAGCCRWRWGCSFLSRLSPMAVQHYCGFQSCSVSAVIPQSKFPVHRVHALDGQREELEDNFTEFDKNYNTIKSRTPPLIGSVVLAARVHPAHSAWCGRFLITMNLHVCHNHNKSAVRSGLLTFSSNLCTIIWV